MIFEIPFNEEIYKRQMSIYFDLSWENQKKNNRLYNYFGFALVIIGCLLLIEINNTKVILPCGLILLGVFCLVSYYRFYFSYLKSKRDFNNGVNEITKEYLENPMSKIEFTEDGLNVKDYSGEKKLLWSNYNFYKIVGKTFIAMGKGNPIAIDEAEVGSANFKNVVETIINAIEKPAANSGFAP